MTHEELDLQLRGDAAADAGLLMQLVPQYAGDVEQTLSERTGRAGVQMVVVRKGDNRARLRLLENAGREQHCEQSISSDMQCPIRSSCFEGDD